jgi:hypothetical protein
MPTTAAPTAATEGCVNSTYPSSVCCGGEIVISTDITKVEAGAFSRCHGISAVTIPSNVVEVGDVGVKEGAFYYCSGLKSITMSTGVISIGVDAFRACTALTSIDFPTTVTFIGESVLNQCWDLMDITIPTSVTAIASMTCLQCTSLSSIVFPTSIITIGGDAFSSSGLTSITLPMSVSFIDDYAFPCYANTTTLYVPASMNVSVYSPVQASCSVETYGTFG